MVKFTLRLSFKAAFKTLLIRTKQKVEGAFATIQLYVPLAAGVEAILCVHVLPLLVEYSNLTLAIVPFVIDQVIAFVEPTIHETAVFGEVTVIIGTCTAIVKTALLWSALHGVAVSNILIMQRADATLGTVQE